MAVVAGQRRRGRELERVVRKAHRRALDPRVDEIHRRRADERGDEQVRRLAEQPLRRVELLEHAVPQDGDALAEGHRLDLVVRDVERRDAEPIVERRELGAHRDAKFRVEVRERLVHQERLGLAHDRPAHGDALALSTRERRGLAVEELAEPERLRDLVHAPFPLRLRHPPELEAVGEVVSHRHVRIERVVLEHHGDVPLLRRLLGHVHVVDQHRAVGDVLEAGDHPQERRLPAARRAHEHDELAVGDVQGEAVDGLDAVREDLRDLVDVDSAHAISSVRRVVSTELTSPASRSSAGIRSPCARVSSSHRASIWSSVRVAAAFGSSIAASRT